MGQQISTLTRRLINGIESTRIILEGLVGEFPNKGDIIKNPTTETEELVISTSILDEKYPRLITISRFKHGVYSIEKSKEGTIFLHDSDSSLFDDKDNDLYREYDTKLREAGL